MIGCSFIFVNQKKHGPIKIGIIVNSFFGFALLFDALIKVIYFIFYSQQKRVKA